MKTAKILVAILLLTALSLTLWFIGYHTCKDDESVLHLGVNAVILEINTDRQQLTVRGTDENSILGETCVISCIYADLIYCNYENGDVQTISFNDLLVGDNITVNVRESEIRLFKTSTDPLKIDQLQLATQRYGQ